MVKVVMITGPSGCGKSTVAESLAASLGHGVAYIKQDDFFGGEFVPYSKAKAGEFTNEAPSHVDFDKLREAVRCKASISPNVQCGILKNILLWGALLTCCMGRQTVLTSAPWCSSRATPYSTTPSWSCPEPSSQCRNLDDHTR
jgi:hypothetical protein